MSYKIKTMGPTEKFKTQYGEMTKYTVQFEGSDEWVSITQKPESPAPAMGQELEGTVEQTQYGAKFKKAVGAAGGFQGRSGTDPATKASIERQSALKAAVEAVDNYSTTYGQEEKLSLEQYAGRIVNLSKVFANAIETGQAAKVEESKPEDKPEEDQINLDDIPF